MKQSKNCFFAILAVLVYLPSSTVVAAQSKNLLNKTLPDDYSPTLTQAWSSNGDFFAFANKDKITVYDIKKENTVYWPLNGEKAGKNRNTLTPPISIKHLLFAPNNTDLLACDTSGNITRFILAPIYEQGIRQKHAVSSFTKKLIISPQAHFLAAIEQQATDLTKEKITIFSCKKEHSSFCINHHTAISHNSLVSNIAFSPNEKELVASFANGDILTLSLATKKTTTISNILLSKHTHVQNMADITSDNKILCGLLPVENKAGWNINYFYNNKWHAVGNINGKSITAYGYHQSSESIAVSNEHGTIFLFTNESNKPKILHRPEKKSSQSSKDFIRLWFDTSGTQLFGIASDGLLCCWNTKTGAVCALDKNINQKQSIFFEHNNKLYGGFCREKQLMILPIESKFPTKDNCSIM